MKLDELKWLGNNGIFVVKKNGNVMLQGHLLVAPEIVLAIEQVVDRMLQPFELKEGDVFELKVEAMNQDQEQEKKNAPE